MTEVLQEDNQSANEATNTEKPLDIPSNFDTTPIAEAANAKSFQHQPLDLHKTQIRLFRLLPRQHSGHITGTIAIHDFDDPECPGYKAVSYTWGPPEPTRHIYIDGKKFIIRENLWHFLTSIPNGKVPWYDVEKGWDYVKEGWLWIDQICIDQAAVAERNHQVNLMARIYTKASEVFLWLGIEADGSNEAIEAIRTGTIKQCEKQVKVLFRRSYWSRLWVLQEVLMGTNILVLCGRKSIPWRELMGPFVPSPRQGEAPWVRPTKIDKVALSIIEEKGHVEHRRNQRLGYMIDTFAGLQCQDPRDKVYGLLSLVRSSGTIPVDYSETPQGVLFKAIEKMIEDESYLEIESHCAIGRKLRDEMMLGDISDEQIYDFVNGMVTADMREIIAAKQREIRIAAAKFKLESQWSLFFKNDSPDWLGRPFPWKSTSSYWTSTLAETEESLKKSGKRFIIEKEDIVQFSKHHYKAMKEFNARWNPLHIKSGFKTAIALAEYDAIVQGLETPVLKREHFEKLSKMLIMARKVKVELGSDGKFKWDDLDQD